MANKLKNMKLPSVDLCKRGANPDAEIKLFKSADSTAKGGEGIEKLADKKSLFERIGEKLFKMVAEENDPTDAIAKSLCVTEIGEMTTAIQKSFESIIADPALSAIEKEEMFISSLHEFNDEVAKSTDVWSTAVDKADTEDEPETEDEEDEPDNEDGFPPSKPEKKVEKGVIDLATINIEKMSAEDRVTLEALEKKYPSGETKPEAKPAEPEIPEAVQKAMDEVAELRKSLDIAKLEVVAKKYEPLGKKAEELAPKLYEMKKSSEQHYTDYVALLDEQLVLADNGIFKEYGSNRSGVGGDLQSIVAEIRKSAPTLSEAEAVVKAYETNPNLDPFTGKLN